MLVKKVKKTNNDPPSSSGSNDSPKTESNNNINNDTDTDLFEHITNIIDKLIELKNKILSPETNNTKFIPSFMNINVNGKNLTDIININKKELLKSLTRFVYQYNCIILKNNKYKKIVVVFPGSSTYLQILDEIIYEGMEDLPIKDGKQHYYVMDYYYQIFKIIKEDLFNNLKSLTGINEEDYQIIFTGHSIGGAIASISSFFYNKEYKFTAQNILITFGQPRVGSERFAKELTNIMNNQTYRIARPNDIATLFPMKDIDFLIKYIKILMLGFDFIKFCLHLSTGDILGSVEAAFDFILNIGDFTEENWYLFQDRTFEDCVYTQSGGLYMIDDDSNTVYHCDDFYNEKRNHFLCRNHKIKSYLTIIDDFKQYRNYLTLDQNIMSGCQEKKFHFLKLLDISSIEWIPSRRLEINNNINQIN